MANNPLSMFTFLKDAIAASASSRSKSNQQTAQTSSEDLLLCILDEIEHFLQGNNMTELPLRSIRQFALNIFVELRAEAVTAVMPALVNCIFQSRY